MPFLMARKLHRSPRRSTPMSNAPMFPGDPLSSWSKFELLSDNPPTSLIWASRGGDGSGKSYFGCTAPGPIWVAGFDPHGMSRVDKRVREGKEIRICRYGFNHLKHEDNRTKVRDAATKIWERFVDEYHAAIAEFSSHSGPKKGTILWDRG